MPAQILNGTECAKTIRAEIATKVEELRAQRGIIPHLAAVLVGDDPASTTYVGMKQRACERTGMKSSVHRLPADSSQQQVEELIGLLNEDKDVHGILVQHPVPKGLDEPTILAKLLPEKDVDGIGPYSLGALVSGTADFVACTPLGIIEMMDRYGIEILGKRAVVVGRSVILGKPVALLLLQRHATVTICHTRTRDLPSVTREADILVAACAQAEMIKGDWIKPGAVVIDAGYNRVEGRDTDVGDVEFQSALEVASWITPVPGGVGPMTIAMLLGNTLKAAEKFGR